MAKTTDGKPQSLADHPGDSKDANSAAGNPVGNEQGAQAQASGGDDARKSGEATSPAIDVEALRAELRAEIAQAMKQAKAPVAAAMVSPAVAQEIRTHEHETRLNAALDIHDRQKAAGEAALLDGPQLFEVGLKGNPTRKVGGSSSIEAQEKYRRYYGINATEHPWHVEQLSAA